MFPNREAKIVNYLNSDVNISIYNLVIEKNKEIELKIPAGIKNFSVKLKEQEYIFNITDSNQMRFNVLMKKDN